MGLKKCEECGENVDQAKAFCPDCGNPFVEEEKRESSSEFDKYAGTVNFSKSVYKMMLTEMELDTSEAPEKEQQTKTPPVSKENKPKESKPSNDSPAQVKLPENEPTDQNKKKAINKRIILALIGGLVLLGLFLLFLLILLYLYLS